MTTPRNFKLQFTEFRLLAHQPATLHLASICYTAASLYIISCPMDPDTNHDPAVMSAESFNLKKMSLLNLPTGLRLEIYERLPISTFVKKFRMWEGYPHSFEFSIVHKGTASPILATCRQTNAEAFSVMARKMKEVSRTAPGILVGLEYVPKLVQPAGPLMHFDSYMCLVAQARKNGNTILASALSGHPPRLA